MLEVLLYVKQRESRRLHLLRNSFKISYFARNHFSVIKSLYEFMDTSLEKPESATLDADDLARVRRAVRILSFWEDFGRLLMQNSSIREKLRAHIEFNLNEISTQRKDFLTMETDLRALMSIQHTEHFMRDTLQVQGKDELLFQHRLYTIEDHFKQVKTFRSGRVENYYNRILEKLIRLKSQGRLDELPSNSQRSLPERTGPELNAQSAYYFGNMKRFRTRILEGEFGEELGYTESKMVLVIFDSHEYLGEASLTTLLTDVNNLLNQAWLESEDFSSKLEYIQRCQLFVEDLAFLGSKILQHVRLLMRLDKQRVFKVRDVG